MQNEYVPPIVFTSRLVSCILPLPAAQAHIMYKNVLWTIGIALFIGFVGISEHSGTRVEGVESSAATIDTKTIAAPTNEITDSALSLKLRPTATPTATPTAMPTALPTPTVTSTIVLTITPIKTIAPTKTQPHPTVTAGDVTPSAGSSGRMQ